MGSESMLQEILWDTKIGWWKVDMARRVLLLSDYLCKTIGTEESEIGYDRFLQSVGEPFRASLKSLMSTDASLFSAEQIFSLCGPRGEVWFRWKVLRRETAADKGLVVSGYAQEISAHPRQVERRTAPQVDHRPLRHRTPEFVARGVGQREITRREHPPVFVDPRGDRIVGILPWLAVEFHGHAREHPRMVVGIEGVDPETLAVGVDARRIEDRRAQRRDRGPEREIHILRFDTVIIMRFFSHVIDI